MRNELEGNLTRVTNVRKAENVLTRVKNVTYLKTNLHDNNLRFN